MARRGLLRRNRSPTERRKHPNEARRPLARVDGPRGSPASGLVSSGLGGPLSHPAYTPERACTDPNRLGPLPRHRPGPSHRPRREHNPAVGWVRHAGVSRARERGPRVQCHGGQFVRRHRRDRRLFGNVPRNLGVYTSPTSGPGPGSTAQPNRQRRPVPGGGCRTAASRARGHGPDVQRHGGAPAGSALPPGRQRSLVAAWRDRTGCYTRKDMAIVPKLMAGNLFEGIEGLFRAGARSWCPASWRRLNSGPWGPGGLGGPFGNALKN